MFKQYVHKQALCQAAQNSGDSQALIVNSLLTDAADGKLDSFRMETLIGSDQVNITFKKKSDSTSSLVAPGDYLVVYEDGTAVAMTESAFNETYEVVADAPVALASEEAAPATSKLKMRLKTSA